jgi:hypothetical protein
VLLLLLVEQVLPKYSYSPPAKLDSVAVRL